MPTKKKQFQGKLAFCSNMYKAPIRVGDVVWPTSEHLYQAMKTKNENEQQKILEANTPFKAKKLGQKVTLREDWDEIKIDVMKLVLCHKFKQHPDLHQKLKQVPDSELVEYNYWGDIFWGVCDGVGENHLGKILQWIKKFENDNEIFPYYCDNYEN